MKKITFAIVCVLVVCFVFSGCSGTYTSVDGVTHEVKDSEVVFDGEVEFTVSETHVAHNHSSYYCAVRLESDEMEVLYEVNNENFLKYHKDDVFTAHATVYYDDYLGDLVCEIDGHDGNSISAIMKK